MLLLLVVALLLPAVLGQDIDEPVGVDTEDVDAEGTLLFLFAFSRV